MQRFFSFLSRYKEREAELSAQPRFVAWINAASISLTVPRSKGGHSHTSQAQVGTGTTVQKKYKKNKNRDKNPWDLPQRWVE